MEALAQVAARAAAQPRAAVQVVAVAVVGAVVVAVAKTPPATAVATGAPRRLHRGEGRSFLVSISNFAVGIAKTLFPCHDAPDCGGGRWMAAQMGGFKWTVIVLTR